MKVSFEQIAFSTCGLILGTMPGLILWLAIDHLIGFLIFNCVVGAFIGFALTLPGVSTTRVMAGTASAILRYNLGDVFGESADQRTAGESKPGEPAAPNTLPAVSPPEKPNGGMHPAVFALLGFGIFATLMGRFGSLDSDGPKELPGDQITRQLRLGQGMDPMVVHPEFAIRDGEPDRVECLLVERIAELRKEKLKDWQQLTRAEKSLDYWRERKRREAAGLSSHPPLVVNIPQPR